MSRFTEIMDIVSKPKDIEDFKGHSNTIGMMVIHIFTENDLAHRRYKNRTARLKRLEELKAPEEILKAEQKHADEALAVMTTYEKLVNFMLTADILGQKGMLSDDPSLDAGIIEDAIKVSRDPKCQHCVNCIMEDSSVWKCNCSGCLIDEPSLSGPEDEEILHEPGLCDFIPDDLSVTEYLDFLDNNREWGDCFVDESELAEEDFEPDGKRKMYVNLDSAISCHHMALLGIESRYKDEIQQMEEWFRNASKGKGI